MGDFRMSNENLLASGEAGGDSGMPPPLPPLKPEWRHHMSMSTGQGLRNNSCDMEDEDEDEEAIPNDSLYGTQVNEGLSILQLFSLFGSINKYVI